MGLHFVEKKGSRQCSSKRSERNQFKLVTHVLEAGVRAAVRRVAPVVEAEDRSTRVTCEGQEICTRCTYIREQKSFVSQNERTGAVCTRLKISDAMLGIYSRHTLLLRHMLSLLGSTRSLELDANFVRTNKPRSLFGEQTWPGPITMVSDQHTGGSTGTVNSTFSPGSAGAVYTVHAQGKRMRIRQRAEVRDGRVRSSLPCRPQCSTEQCMPRS